MFYSADFISVRVDLDDCIGQMYDGKELTIDEANNAETMLNTVLAFCKDNGIIDNYSGYEIDMLLCKLSKEYSKEYYGEDEEKEGEEE